MADIVAALLSACCRLVAGDSVDLQASPLRLAKLFWLN